MARQTLNVQLRLPEQDLQFLTIGSDNPKLLKAWVEQLPMGNLGESAKQLYQLIGELNRLATLTPKSRFTLVEILRPSIQYVCSTLGKHYLNQPVVLPEKAKKIANLAQALQTHLATAYKIIAVAGSSKLRDRENQKIVSTSIHRALTAMTQTLLRCYQLYYPTPRYLWLEIHQLFLLAEFNKLLGSEVEDPDFKFIESSNIQDAYVRALLLAASRPNQMRQKEIQSVYDAIESWTDMVEVNASDNNSDIFVFNLDADLPPTYRNIAKKSETGNYRFIDASRLVEALKIAVKERSQEIEKPALVIPRDVSDTMVEHISMAWGSLTERSFARIPASGKITICIGLGATHYFLSNGLDFEKQLFGEKKSILRFEDSSPFSKTKTVYSSDQETKDVWSDAYDGPGHTMSKDFDAAGIEVSNIENALGQQEKEKESSGGESSKYNHFVCDLVNTSPGGYCMQWSGDVPSHLRTGEIIGIQEAGQTNWRIGVIRWVKQLPKKGAQLGVELLAPNAIPCGTKVVKKGGETTEYMRTLLLPELKAIGQPATLITPNIAFNEGYKVVINRMGEELRTMLMKQISATPSFTQFKFKEPPPGTFLDTLDNAPGDSTKEDFDSIWSSL